MIAYIKGFKDCLEGFALLTQPGIRRFVIIPLGINMVLFAGAIYLLAQQMQSWLDSLLPQWLAWLEWLIWPLFVITILLLVFYCFTLVANLVAAPFNSLLAARVEAHLTGARPENMDTEQFWKLALRSFAAEIHKLLYFIKWMIPLLVITFVPGLNLAAPFLWFIYAAWSFAIEYTDYPLANHGKLFSEIRQYNRDNRMQAMGLGTAVFIMTSIPVLNFLSMPVAIAGATKLTTRKSRQ